MVSPTQFLQMEAMEEEEDEDEECMENENDSDSRDRGTAAMHSRDEPMPELFESDESGLPPASRVPPPAPSMPSGAFYSNHGGGRHGHANQQPSAFLNQAREVPSGAAMMATPRAVAPSLPQRPSPPTTAGDGIVKASQRLALPAVARRRSSDLPSTGVNAISAVAAGQTAAIERIATVEGWQKMNAGLKTSERAHNWAHLRGLLQQCFQAPITLELIKKNDTPKMVNRLSKTCPDADVRKLATDLVAYWKHDIIGGGNAATSGDRTMVGGKRPSPDATTTSSGVQPSSGANAMGSLFERIADEEKGIAMSANVKRIPKEQRPRTAKAYPAKFRSTGLENEIDSAAAASGRAKATTSGSADASGASKRTPPVPLPAIPKKAKISGGAASGSGGFAPGQVAPSPAAITSPTAAAIPGGPFGAVSPVQSPTATAKPALPVSLPPPQPKRLIQESAGFMAALEDQAAGKKLPKVVKKKPLPVVVRSSTVPQAPAMATETTGGLYSDTTRRSSTTDTVGDSLSLDANTGDAVASISEEPKGLKPPGDRRVHFADERGRELVAVRFFESDEGERGNVTKAMSSDDMKHFEMANERSFMAQHKVGHHPHPHLQQQSRGATSMITWRLIRFDSLVELVEGGRGVASTERDVEARRQSLVMEAFYDGLRTPDILLEPDDFDARRDHIPQRIPLEEIVDDDDEARSSGSGATPGGDVTASPQMTGVNSSASLLPPELQSLMDGLKKQGMVSGGTTPSITIPPGLAASLAAVTGVRQQMPDTTASMPYPNMAMPPPAMMTGVPPAMMMPPGMIRSGTQIPPGIFAPPPGFAPQQSPFMPMGMMPSTRPGLLPAPPATAVGMMPLASGGGGLMQGRSSGLLAGPGPPAGGTFGMPMPGDNGHPQYGGMPPAIGNHYGFQQNQQPQRPCPFYSVGKCNFGDKCRYSHGDEPQQLEAGQTGGGGVPATRREAFDRRQGAGGDAMSRGGGRFFRGAGASGAPYDRRRRSPPPRRGDETHGGGGYRDRERRFPSGYGRRDRRSRRSRSPRSGSRSRSRSRSPRSSSRSPPPTRRRSPSPTRGSTPPSPASPPPQSASSESGFPQSQSTNKTTSEMMIRLSPMRAGDEQHAQAVQAIDASPKTTSASFECPS